MIKELFFLLLVAQILSASKIKTKPKPKPPPKYLLKLNNDEVEYLASNIFNFKFIYLKY